MNPARHMDFLDDFGGGAVADAKREVAQRHAERGSIASTLKKLLNDVSEKERLFDMLSFQVQEISAAKLKPGEAEKLERRLGVLENAEKIREGVETAYGLVYRGGSDISAHEALLRAADAMDRIGLWYCGGRNAPYIWLRCPGEMGIWEFFDLLLNSIQVAGTPGAGFGECGEGYFRLSTFGSREDTVEAAARLVSLLAR